MEKEKKRVRIGKNEYACNAQGELRHFWLPEGRFTFKPWNWGEKNRVLDRCLVHMETGDGGFTLDVSAFNGALLETTLVTAQSEDRKEVTVGPAWFEELPPGLGDRLLELALWTCGLVGEEKEDVVLEPLTERNGTALYQEGDCTYSLRRWTWGEKNHVIHQSIRQGREGERFSTWEFNERLLLTTLETVRLGEREVPVTREYLRQMNARLGDLLLAEAQRLNELSQPEREEIIRAVREDLPHEAITTFELCREFGWTPRQVSDEPSCNISRMLLVLNAQKEGAAPPHNHDGDATTILIHEDEEN